MKCPRYTLPLSLFALAAAASFFYTGRLLPVASFSTTFMVAALSACALILWRMFRSRLDKPSSPALPSPSSARAILRSSHGGAAGATGRAAGARAGGGGGGGGANRNGATGGSSGGAAGAAAGASPSPGRAGSAASKMFEGMSGFRQRRPKVVDLTEDGPVLFEGFLCKRSSGKLPARWQKRYFKLDRLLLQYFASYEDGKNGCRAGNWKMLGAFDLAQVRRKERDRRWWEDQGRGRGGVEAWDWAGGRGGRGSARMCVHMCVCVCMCVRGCVGALACIVMGGRMCAHVHAL